MTSIENVDRGLAAVALNHPHLGNAEIAVEGHFLIRLIARTLDLDHYSRSAFDAFVAIDSETVRQEQREVGNAIIVRESLNPSLLADPRR